MDDFCSTMALIKLFVSLFLGRPFGKRKKTCKILINSEQTKTCHQTGVPTYPDENSPMIQRQKSLNYVSTLQCSDRMSQFSSLQWLSRCFKNYDQIPMSQIMKYASNTACLMNASIKKIPRHIMTARCFS